MKKARGRTSTSKLKLAKKRSVDLSGYNRFWEMKERGAHVTKDNKVVARDKKVFRCMCCGSTTGCKGDWGGRPDPSNCTPECQADLRATLAGSRVSDAFRENYDQIKWEGRHA